MLSVHPVVGGRFEVVRVSGRPAGPIRDQDSFTHNGGGTEMTYETVPARKRTVDGGDAHTAHGLLGDSLILFCRCGATNLSEETADAIGEALDGWLDAGAVTTRPTLLTVDM